MSPGERMAHRLTKRPTKMWPGSPVWNHVFPSHSCTVSLASGGAIVHQKEVILDCQIKLAVKRGMYLVCMFWLANHSLSHQSWRHVDCFEILVIQELEEWGFHFPGFPGERLNAHDTADGNSLLLVVGMLRFMSLSVFDINLPSFPTPFYSVLVSVFVFTAFSTVFHSINSPDNSLLSHSVLAVLFLSDWSFQLYVSLWKSPTALI